MKTTFRFGTAILAAMAAIALGGTAAYAEAPTNDIFATATSVGSLPFSTSIDTTEATTDALEAEANAGCDAPATDAGVWFKVTAPDDGVMIAAAQGDYSSAITVLTGAPGAFTTVECGAEQVSWEAAAGETYLLLVYDNQQDGGGNGGHADFGVSIETTTTEVALTVDPLVRFDRSGAAHVTGSVTCTEGAYTYLDVMLSQRVGRRILGAGDTLDFFCTGDGQPWSVVLEAENGLFRGGRAVLNVRASTCSDEGGCDAASVEGLDVQLRGGRTSQ